MSPARPEPVRLAPAKADTRFELVSDFEPKGDQPRAIEELLEGLARGDRHQVLLGVTGSGKTFTVASVVAQVNRPTLVLAHNKTLAAQLYQEFKAFFPRNAVEYFVSYYDYYQPEAYVPQSDTYIEKESTINEEIDRMRLSATRSLFERRDVLIVASVSCIYGLGSPEAYYGMLLFVRQGDTLDRRDLLSRLVEARYDRNDYELKRGTFRVRGDVVEIVPAYEESGIRIELFGDEVERISSFDPLTGKATGRLAQVAIYPSSHYVTPQPRLADAVKTIEAELMEVKPRLESQGKLLEAQRLYQRTMFDLEMLRETGHCHGIENYSRHLSGRKPGEPPPTLLDYLPKDGLIVVDESHQSIPQVRGMFHGDRQRKTTLVEYGFRLPSALDNRPLSFEEFEERVGQALYVSATPGPYELQKAGGVVVEQVIRPTGLMDPRLEVRPVQGQVDDLLAEVRVRAEKGQRVLVTTLTKRMAEDLTEYYHDLGVRVRYLHSDIETLERVRILRDLRKGEFDVLVGINLLREGLDLPEVSLVAILDADKEGFLRSAGALIQTMGRAARNVEGMAILYADKITDSMKAAMGETEPPPDAPGGVQPGERHHPGEHQEGHRRPALLGVRARLPGRPRGGRGARGALPLARRHRGGDQVAREADARGGEGARVRARGRAARPDQEAARPRVRAEVDPRLPLAQLLDRRRPAEVVALGVREPRTHARRALFRRLDALRHGLHQQLAGGRHQRGHEPLARGGRVVEAGDEATVELQVVGRRLGQLEQASLAGPEIVVGQPHVDLQEAVAQPGDEVRLRERALVDLEHEVHLRRVGAQLLQRLEEPRRLQLDRVRVQEEDGRLGPVAHQLHRLAAEEAAELGLGVGPELRPRCRTAPPGSRGGPACGRGRGPRTRPPARRGGSRRAGRASSPRPGR